MRSRAQGFRELVTEGEKSRRIEFLPPNRGVIQISFQSDELNGNKTSFSKIFCFKKPDSDEKKSFLFYFNSTFSSESCWSSQDQNLDFRIFSLNIL